VATRRELIEAVVTLQFRGILRTGGRDFGLEGCALRRQHARSSRAALDSRASRRPQDISPDRHPAAPGPSRADRPGGRRRFRPPSEMPRSGLMAWAAVCAPHDWLGVRHQRRGVRRVGLGDRLAPASASAFGVVLPSVWLFSLVSCLILDNIRGDSRSLTGLGRLYVRSSASTKCDVINPRGLSSSSKTQPHRPAGPRDAHCTGGPARALAPGCAVRR
jgi:hypothetical protein